MGPTATCIIRIHKNTDEKTYFRLNLKDRLTELTLCNEMILFSSISATIGSPNWVFYRAQQKEPDLLNTGNKVKKSNSVQPSGLHDFIWPLKAYMTHKEPLCYMNKILIILNWMYKKRLQINVELKKIAKSDWVLSSFQFSGQTWSVARTPTRKTKKYKVRH